MYLVTFHHYKEQKGKRWVTDLGALKPKPQFFFPIYPSIHLHLIPSPDRSAIPSVNQSITRPFILLLFSTQSDIIHPFHFTSPLISSFISHNHQTIPSVSQSAGTWYLPAIANPAEGCGRLAARRHTGELHLAALHGLLLHLHRGRLRGHQDGQRGHLVVRGVCVELAEVPALIGHADVGQLDAHQPRREEHHLETVVLQGWRVDGDDGERRVGERERDDVGLGWWREEKTRRERRWGG